MKKFKYERPVIVDLGEMARGDGTPPCDPTGTTYRYTCSGNGFAAYSACITSGNFNTSSDCVNGTTASTGSCNPSGSGNT